MKLAIVAILAPLVSASYERIAGYEPGSQVTDHNAIDLDQKSIETQLAAGTLDSYVRAEEIYNEGGHSKSYASIKLDSGLSKALSKGAQITAVSVSGENIVGKSYSAYEAGSTNIKFQYATTDIQATHVGCLVGALPSNEHRTDGCLEEAGSISAGGSSYSYTYTVDEDNNNGRTIAGFSTSAQDKQYDGCPGCPYAEYKKFYDYYGEFDYAHQWVTAAFAGTNTNFNNGNADFSKYGFTGREQVIKKGTAYMNIYMYVIREFEDALDDCSRGCIDCNDGSVHAWDEGVAFYTGSLEGFEGKGSGKLLHALADKRCENFKTCGLKSDELEGGSYVNFELAQLFTLGNYNLVTGNCDAVRANIDDIVDLMAVPMIQGTLRYAYKVDKLSGAEKEKAEGAVFAAAVLPRVAACDEDDAMTIYKNMAVGASSTSFDAVKKAFESNYKCMNIDGGVVGGLWNDGVGDYYEGAKPAKVKGASNGLAIGLGVSFGVVGLLGAGFIVNMIRKEKQGKPMFMNTKDAVDV